MSERKNIDRLFQEKFKDFETNPPEELWGNIEAKLEKEKTRRIIPLWWKLSGIAAVLLVGWLITMTKFNEKAIPSNQVTVEENKTSKGTENESNTNPTTNTIIQPNEEVNKEVIVDVDMQKSNGSDSVSEEAKTGTKKHRQESTPKKPIGHKPLLNKAIADRNISKKEKSAANETVGLASQNNVNGMSEAEKSVITTNQAIVNKETATKANFDTSKEISLESLKGTGKAIAETDSKINPKDSTKTDEKPKNPLEELLVTKQDDKKKQETKQSKWQITSNVAPVFMGALANGSAIDSTFANNSKTFNTNVGFGLGVSYAVNSKLSIRTGLNKVNMNYNTNDVFYYASMQTRTLSGLNPSGAGYTIQVENDNTLNPSASLGPTEGDLLSFEQNIVYKNKGYINQEIGYLEMPVELTYALMEKRFGIKIIGGFSTLFLQDNSISVVSDNRSTLLGEANNLNNIHFSTNIGLGVKYDLLKSFEFHIEPTFKYQINTFNSNAGNFRPYLFGVYSGFSYKF